MKRRNERMEKIYYTTTSKEQAGTATLTTKLISEQEHDYGQGRSFYNDKGINSSRGKNNPKYLYTLITEF